MKKIFLLFFTTVCLLKLQAQNGNAETIATKIAQKMKDSLQLTNRQQEQIYQLNMQITNQKIAARQQYSGNDLLRRKTQQIENTRDSLYKTVLTEQQFILYADKKSNLVNNN